MSGTRAPRRRALYAMQALVLLGALAWWAVPADARPVAAAAPDGAALYTTGCSSCHGIDGHGVTTANGEVRGPDITNAGAALAYFQVSTGRMPLADSNDPPVRKRTNYDETQIDAIVATVAALGDGPALPTVDVADADLAVGGELYRANCQACHSASGAGGALSYGDAAPALDQSEPLQVAAAIRSGPGQMPVFGPNTLSQASVDDITRYVQYLRTPDDRGGAPIGRTGPVPEGFVALTLGIGALLAAVGWIGTRSRLKRRAAGSSSA